MRKIVNVYKEISSVIKKFTHKKFPQSWVFNILKREDSITINEEITKNNIYNL